MSPRITTHAAGADDPALSVIIVTFGDRHGLGGALDALQRNTPVPYELIVVDNPHPELPSPSLDGHAERGQLTMLRNESNLGFAAAADRGARDAAAGLFCFLNPDTEVEEGWFEPLAAALAEPAVAAAVPMLLEWDGRIQDAGALLSGDGTTVAWGAGGDPDDDTYGFPREVAYGSGACLLVRREAFFEAGGFPPDYTPAYCEDVDLGRGLAALGLATVVVPWSRVRHRSGAAGDRSGVDAMVRDATRTLRRRRWPDLSHRPSLDGWEQRPHRLLQARDADTAGRVLIVVDRSPEPGSVMEQAIGSLARDLPGIRITLACTASGETARADIAPDLLRAGIEVTASLDGDWLRERAFHYDLVVIERAEDRGEEEALASQPQAERAEMTDFLADPRSVLAAAGIALAAPTLGAAS